MTRRAFLPFRAAAPTVCRQPGQEALAHGAGVARKSMTIRASLDSCDAIEPKATARRSRRKRLHSSVQHQREIGTALDARDVCLVNVYAPNLDDTGFFRTVLNTAAEHIGPMIVLVCDLNCVLDGRLDCLSLRVDTKPVMTSIEGGQGGFGITNVWRT
ncbi:hypothetical protein NDU88_008013 [Pleurodeles waltl]|uniref:Uncharacterized protein n=1 Tax=Pleurodeles waltl TaxID=8319 RepID=A0AAV7RUL6_PLEWA|nr:hypothetical protein NDU88_008013 [Pleurodeles waltl]